jgi:glycosyltransferase A (GT-A) superfamily protein (DUF2064 family)
VAAAALEDTIDTVQETPAVRRTLVVAGPYRPPTGWTVSHQRGNGLGQRLAHAFADTAMPGVPSLLIGMDTPQVTTVQLTDVVGRLSRADAVLAPALDGGWWALALHQPQHAEVLLKVAMSTRETMTQTLRALRGRGLVVTTAGTLRDVDTAEDAWAVAREWPAGRFAAMIRTHLPWTGGTAT